MSYTYQEYQDDVNKLRKETDDKRRKFAQMKYDPDNPEPYTNAKIEWKETEARNLEKMYELARRYKRENKRHPTSRLI